MRNFLVLACATATALLAVESTDKRLNKAAEAFAEVMGTPDKAIPQELLEKAQCIVIVPGLKKGAIGFGGKYGRGFASCRKASQGWGAPAGVRIEGGSFGFQLGGSSTDVIMLVMNQSGMNRLLQDKFTLGGEAAAAAGPVGREASAMTDAMMKAEILSYSRSRGLFAGLSLEGATLRQDSEENQKLYGRAITNKEIIEQGASVPRAATRYVSLLNKYSGRGASASSAETVKSTSTEKTHTTEKTKTSEAEKEK